jgi:hypothetical protein
MKRILSLSPTLKKLRPLIPAGLILTGLISTTQAGIILSDDFEYADQAAFQANWPAIGTVAPISAELSTLQAVSGTKSIRFPGTATTGQSRNQRLFAETGTLAIGDVLTWSFDFYDSAPTAGPQRNHNNLQDSTAPSGTNQLIAMGMNNNQTGANSGGQFYMGRILGYAASTVADPDGGPAESVASAGAFFKLNDFATSPTRSLGWHNLMVEISTDDGLSTDYAFYVDDILAERVSNVGIAAEIRSYDVIRIGSGLSNGSTEAFTDNMQLELVPVPEPGALGLLSVGAVGLAVRRRRAKSLSDLRSA